MSNIIRITAQGISTEELSHCAAVPPEAVILGEARETGAVHFGSDKVTIGTWECTPYAEILAYPNATEYTTVLSGRVAITDADGSVQEFGPGESYVLKSGFEGRFEVLETLRKIYVLIED
ncbi:cupin domain-containing protein [Paracoccus sp. MBLB3053]|uniref:Cupin domain-containing protein n=1 Tax=Paracoccus aurantius TaxID=3073814 RepID=A0ABU2HXI2_9RHOB|nr:cupin domain-containing protein [Paracoccus sp. MBLB3053]MDS9469024.1 cupin domain-containing protein [Paracoccus sp. MBLB3053]